ncbi:MAG: hypothetical protein H0V94_10125 [Actinobacteria bacterium]|nr:hypothetical protein [Actinomycetota bacterium]
MRRPAVLAVVAAAALAVGVTAAWAGFPNFKQADSTFVASSTTKGGGKTTTATRLSELAAAGGNSSSATIFVHFSATGVSGSTEFVASLAGEQTWACGNNGGGFPSAPNKVTEPITVSSDTLPLNTRNGRVSYNGDGLFITLDPPSANLPCPSGQTALLAALRLDSLRIGVDGDIVNFFDVQYPTSAGWGDPYPANTYVRSGYSG